MTLRVLHIITGLHAGGAEGMLLKLISAQQEMEIVSSVVSLSDGGVIGERMRKLGFKVHTLAVNGVRSAATAIPRVLSIADRERPSVIQTWLPHADLVGAIVGMLRRRIPVIWNVRMTNMSLERTRTRLLAQMVNSYISHVSPRAIVCCAQEALDEFSNFGYARPKMTVIPNGFDLDAFKPDAAVRAKTRDVLGVKGDEFLVGIVGRFHPMKDHRSFVRAAAAVRGRVRNVRFLMVGRELEPGNAELQKWVREAGIEDVSLCLGSRTDLPALYAAMDLGVLSSRGEGFPNVLGEAMACGVPCVSTSVGGSRAIIGDTGYVVPPSDPMRLADAITAVIEMPEPERLALGRAARERIREHFSIAAVARMYAELYSRVSGLQ